MRETQVADKSTYYGKSNAKKAERSFDLTLPAMIAGRNHKGEDFEEQTELSSISSQEAIFWLKNKVVIGSKLTLSLNVPKTLILENQLNLIVSGEVVFATSDPNNRGQQLISVRLDRLYKIQPIYSSL